MIKQDHHFHTKIFDIRPSIRPDCLAIAMHQISRDAIGSTLKCSQSLSSISSISQSSVSLVFTRGAITSKLSSVSMKRSGGNKVHKIETGQKARKFYE